jgi:hypothetical protein
MFPSLSLCDDAEDACFGQTFLENCHYWGQAMLSHMMTGEGAQSHEVSQGTAPKKGFPTSSLINY